MTPRDTILDLKSRMGRSIIGQEHVVERLLIGLLADGNLLVEGLPGLAKTRSIKVLAKNLEAGFSRIQFTPDLLPSDVTGTEVYHQVDGKGEFHFAPGPIFNNLVLADEINRAPAKVQSALLEAMEERQVTVAGKTHRLPPLFMVMATQNPVEQEGTYPLPEAQIDRFLMHVLIRYPDEAAEREIIRLVRDEEAGRRSHKPWRPGRTTEELRSRSRPFSRPARRSTASMSPMPSSSTSSTCCSPRAIPNATTATCASGYRSAPARAAAWPSTAVRAPTPCSADATMSRPTTCGRCPRLPAPPPDAHL